MALRPPGPTTCLRPKLACRFLRAREERAPNPTVIPSSSLSLPPFPPSFSETCTLSPT